MKLKYILVISMLICFSCKKTYQTNDIENHSESPKDLIIFFSGDIFENSKLEISINGITVFDKLINYNDSNKYIDKLKIIANIRDTIGYNFKIRFSNKEKTFFLPANGLDSVLIAYSCYFDIKLVEDSQSVKKEPFEIRLSKNIEDNCKVKIAADKDTLYKGEFINNFPHKLYNSMIYKPYLDENKAYNFFIEINKYYIYFDCIPKKYLYANVSFICSYYIATNLDEDWIGLWSYE